MCSHVHWFEWEGTGRRWTLIDTHRVSRLVADLTEPHRQYPSLTFFLGRSLKTRMLSRIFSENNTTRRKPHPIGNLEVDNKTLSARYPLFFLDTTVSHASTDTVSVHHHCHETQLYQIRVDRDITFENLRSLLYTNLILSNCHVVCLFADDFGGNDKCVQYVRKLLQAVPPSRHEGETPRPRLMSVTSGRNNLDLLFQLECSTSFHLLFESHTIVSIDNGPDSSLRDLESIKQSLSIELDAARERREQHYLLFNAVDLAQSLTNHVDAFARHPEQEVRLLSPEHHPARRLGDGIARHVQLFAELPQIRDLDGDAVANYIASALLLNAYLDSKHYFHPVTVFNVFLETPLRAALQNTTHKNLLEMIRREFEILFEELTSLSSFDIRCKSAAFKSMAWNKLRSNSTCLFCLVRPPEYIPPCNHGICEQCVAYGTPGAFPYGYFLDHCYMCGYNTDTTYLCKPPTAEPSLLSIDGGGIRGIIALKLLQRLQDQLLTPYPLWKYFDFIAGTSVGGFIVLDLVLCRSTIASSVERFLDLAPRIFHRSEDLCPLFFCKLVASVRWWFQDSKYDSTVLDAILQEVFGVHEQFFGHQRCSTAKIGITATTAVECGLCLFTNYSGPTPEHRAGYALLRPGDLHNEPKAWEVARCTSAAPGYFTPKTIDTFGALQDGGMRANNPTEVGLWEVRRIWPHTQRPCVVLSVGTGYSQSPTHSLCPDRTSTSLMSSLRHTWTNGFVKRLISGFLSSPCLHGQNSWVALVHRTDVHSRPDFFRLNYEFLDREPALDDVRQLNKLDLLVSQSQIDLVPHRNALWASRFFFEFSRPPRFVQGRYVGHGSILCRFQDARPLLTAISSQYPDWSFVQDHNIPLRLDRSALCCRRCGFFRGEITIEARRLDVAFHLEIVYDERERRRLSGTPNSIQWFTTRQTQNGTWNAWHVTACCGGGGDGGGPLDGRRPRKRRRVSQTASLSSSTVNGMSYI